MDPIDLGTEVEIQLDVFSGRPNPRWTLSGDRAKELGELLRDLEPAGSVEPPGLGYRGFLVSARDATIRAYDAVLAVSRYRRTEHFRDARGVEELLLRQAHDHGYGEVLEVFREGTESKPKR